jgi:hypothetical protein
MDKGFTKKEISDIEKKITSFGWKIEINNLDAINKDDSIWWYEYDEYAPILRITQGKEGFEIIATGDISITDPNNDENHFYFRGGKPDFGEKDELTEHLVKYGDYGDNNWFEIVPISYINGKWKEDTDIDDYIEGSLKDTISFLMKML